MYLVAFIIRIYHDARSPERQTYAYVQLKLLFLQQRLVILHYWTADDILF